MKFPNVLLLLLLLLLSGSVGFGASPSPTPGSDAPAEAASRSDLEKIGLLRIWYFGDPKSPRITVGCQGSNGDASVLGSYMRAGQTGSYRAMKPGSYSLKILDGSALPDATGRLAGGEAIAQPEKVDLKGGFLTTIVVHESGNKFNVSVFDEGVSKHDDAGAALRVFDYSGLDLLSLRVESSGESKEIWNSKKGQSATSAMQPGPCRLELLRSTADKQRPVTSSEVDIAPSSLTSVLVFQDRYGDPSISVLDDRDFSVSKEEVKSLMGEH